MVVITRPLASAERSFRISSAGPVTSATMLPRLTVEPRGKKKGEKRKESKKEKRKEKKRQDKTRQEKKRKKKEKKRKEKKKERKEDSMMMTMKRKVANIFENDVKKEHCKRQAAHLGM